MTGRKPKTPSHRTTHLRGKRLPRSQRPERGTWVDGKWVEMSGDWKTFEPGDQEGDLNNNFAHGAYAEDEIAPRARALVQAVLEDAAMPDHLRSPAFRFALDAWGRAEASASLILDYISGQGIGPMITPRMGGTKTPLEIWKSFEASASRMRSELGITPASYARIAKDLGLTQKANEDALERLAAGGAQITARRAELESGQS